MAIQIQSVSVWIPLPKSFLTAQVVNTRFPLHVPWRGKHTQYINIQIFCSLLRFRCQMILCIIFGVQGFDSFMAVLWLTRLCYVETNLTLTCPLPNCLFVISQIPGDVWPEPTRVSQQVEERTLERGCWVCVLIRSPQRPGSILAMWSYSLAYSLLVKTQVCKA